MREAEAILHHEIEKVKSIVSRPGMWAASGSGTASTLHVLVENLCFITEQEHEFQRIREDQYRFGKLGIEGAFHAVFGETSQYTEEVASVWAEPLHRLGFLKVDRTLDDDEWTTLHGIVRRRFEDHDIRLAKVVELLGSPSLVVGKQVLCYVSASTGEWVFCDFLEDRVPTYLPGEGRYEVQGWQDPDPLLRDVRIPASTFDDGLILTLYGKVLRWGTGWWISHPPGRDLGTPPGVREQLRQIQTDDPSQALGPQRP